MQLSRRQVISNATLVALGIGQTGTLNALLGSPSPSVRAINSWQTLFQPNDPLVVEILKARFPKYLDDSSLVSLLPFTAIVRNGGKVAVRAYSLTWVAVTESPSISAHGTFSRLFVSEPSVSKPSSIIGTGRNPILQPGQFAVATPLFLVSENKFRRQKFSVPVNDLMAHEDEAPSFIAASDSSASYKVRRDLKICKHTVIGDRLEFAARYEMAYDIERGAARELLLGMRGAHAGDISASLGEALSNSDPSLNAQESAVRARFFLATQLRAGRYGSQLAMAGLEHIASRRPLRLKSVKRTHIKRAIA